jgi:immunity protein 35 of polymorphic toxin system
MIDKRAAEEIANSYLSKVRIGQRQDATLDTQRTLEQSFGWVFFYESKKYLDTGDYHFRALGNSPFIVDRSDGSVHVTATARPIEYYIAEYEKRRRGSGSSNAT